MQICWEEEEGYMQICDDEEEVQEGDMQVCEVEKGKEDYMHTTHNTTQDTHTHTHTFC